MLITSPVLTSWTRPSHCRILVDTSALWLLAPRVPRKLIINRKKDYPRLWHTLSTLDMSGFEIILTHMVAFEAANMLGNGQRVGGGLAENSGSHLRNCVYRFLKGHLDWMIPPADDDLSLSAQFIRGLNDLYPTGMPGEDIEALTLFLLDNYDKNLGDEATLQIVSKMADNGAPVVYLSNDAKSLRDVKDSRPDLQMYCLPAFSFLDALSMSGILPLTNIRQLGAPDFIAAELNLYGDRRDSRFMGTPPCTRHLNEKRILASYIADTCGTQPPAAQLGPNRPPTMRQGNSGTGLPATATHGN